MGCRNIADKSSEAVDALSVVVAVDVAVEDDEGAANAPDGVLR